MKHAVGILLDHDVFKAIRKGRTGYERISLYDKAARNLGLKLVYMSLPCTGRKSTSGFVRHGSGYVRVTNRIPKVVHNRTLVFSYGLRTRLQKLAADSIVFNRQNRYGKYKIHKLLKRSASLTAYIPKTVLFSKAGLSGMLAGRRPLFLKPDNGSVGDGIMKLTPAAGSKWRLHAGNNQSRAFSSAGIVQLVSTLVRGRRYVVQEALALARYKGRPYDLRVSVQRNETGRWQVTGIVGKVAAKGKCVTNVAKGGKVLPCNELFQGSGLEAAAVTDNVTNAALAIAEYLGGKLPHMADMGLDMGVDRQGRVCFIEMNGRDQRITFKKAGLNDTFYRVYETPLRYARRLLEQKTGSP